jgi:hypothetical protein
VTVSGREVYGARVQRLPTPAKITNTKASAAILVGGSDIDDDVDVEIIGNGPLDKVEVRSKFPGAVSRQTFANDVALATLSAGKQRADAVPL